MRQLSYETLRQVGYDGYILTEGTEKVLQFGDGNFLRAFADYFLDVANEKTGYRGKAVVVQPVSPRPSEAMNAQEGLYTLYSRGWQDGKTVDERRVISVISRCLNARAEFDEVLRVAKSPELEMVISNTTEAGIVYDPECRLADDPPASFPAKVAKALYARYQAGQPGLIFLCCELIDHNGEALRDCVLRHGADWSLGDGFRRWVEEENLFCTTLVDRIVTGKIQDPALAEQLALENGYMDELADVAEPYALWIIEGPAELADHLPFCGIGLPVSVVDDVMPYKKRKVRVLNGSHTGMALGAYLAGKETVKDCMEDPVLSAFLRQMLTEEILPGIDQPREELEAYVDSVLGRFRNPFLNHQLLSIALNSSAKWRARNLPSLLDCVERTGRIPTCLAMSLAMYMAFYSSGLKERAADGGGLVCARPNDGVICERPGGGTYTIQDDVWVLDFYWARRDADGETLCRDVLKNTALWEQDLTLIPGLLDTVCADLLLIRSVGVREAFRRCLRSEENRG